jgi:Lsr2
MAQHQRVVLVDDLDGSAAERTVVFSVDGERYQIDLSAPNIERLHGVLAPYLAKARKVGSTPSAERRPRRPRAAARATPRAGTDTVPALPETPPSSTDAEPAGTGAAQDGATPGHRTLVAVPLFSNPDAHLPTPATATAKPHTALFSTAG